MHQNLFTALFTCHDVHPSSSHITSCLTSIPDIQQQATSYATSILKAALSPLSPSALIIAATWHTYHPRKLYIFPISWLYYERHSPHLLSLGNLQANGKDGCSQAGHDAFGVGCTAGY